MKYATVEKIESLSPIENCDNIVLARVLGWDVVVRKYHDNFQDKMVFSEGDFCIYIPIDTIVNNKKPWFSFIGHTKKIKTRKIRGVYSQGLILSMDDIKNVPGFDGIKMEEGFDVSDILCVGKYEKEKLYYISKNDFLTKVQQDKILGFPVHLISKTDEDNLRSKNKALLELIGKEVVVTQKQDGSSMTCIWRSSKKSDGTIKYEFELAKRNISIWKVVDGLTVHEINDYMVDYAKQEDLISLFHTNVALQGEFCGPKICGNRLDLSEYHWYIFNIKNLDTNEYYGRDQIIEICQTKSLEVVPELSRLFVDEETTIEFFQNLANQVKYPKVDNSDEGEGIVIRPTIPFFSKKLGKIFSVKVINQKYKD